MRRDSCPIAESKSAPRSPSGPALRVRPRAALARVALLVLCTCLGPLAAAPSLAGEESLAEKPPAEQLTLQSVQDRLKGLESARALDEATKTKLRELYQQAIGELEAAKKWSESAARFESMATSAPEELAKIKADLAALARQSAFPIPEGSLVQLEQTLSQKSNELAAEKAKLAELEAEPKLRAARRIEIPKLVGAAREKLAELENQLQAPVQDSSEPAAAKRLAIVARRQALEQELASHQTELKAYDVRAELLPLRRDLAAGRVALAEQELTKWREAVNRQRQRDAEDQLRRAKREAQQSHPAIADLTRQNAELAERRKDLAQLIVQTTRQLETANQRLASLQDQFTRTQSKVDTVGQTNAIGLMLRKQRETMPDVRSQIANIRDRQPIIQECQLELLQFEDRRTDLANLEEQIRKELQIASRSEYAADDQYALEAAARRALETEKEYLDAMIVDLNSYFEKLIDLDYAEQQLAEQTDEYVKYINERVLWIRSTSVLGMTSLGYVGQAAGWLVNPESWLATAAGLYADCCKDPFQDGAAALVLGLLIWIQPRLKRRLNHVGERAELANCCSLVPTVEAIALTALTSAVVPGALWYLAWRLGAGVATPFSAAVSSGLLSTAGVYLVFDLLEKKCRRNGLADAHFGWPSAALRPIRHYVRIAKATLLPLIFIVATMDSQPNDRWSDSFGRLSFVVAMLISALLVQRCLRPKGSVYQALMGLRRIGWPYSLRFVWRSAAVALPLALAVLALTGYYYTAQQLGQRMFTGGYVLFGLMLVRSVLLRWVLVKRRKMAIQHARQRRAAQAESPSGEAAAEIPVPSEPNLDLATINVQTQRFVEFSLTLAGFLGMWFVWVDVLPALRALDNILLWQAVDQAEATSLADVSLAILVFTTAVIAARNAPGLLEMALLQRLPLDAGFRYTVGTVSRYVIIIVGLLATCNIVGLRWGTVQWLVAAVSVGLGFGLQEIFANFVSGLIILFERPVRVGDIVTIADTTGVISRIRMRATTITNWDRKEFIVPNKDFITGRLLNWTLSDSINRIVLKVGIAYGSDTALAASVILKVAQENPLVMKEPAPRVTFEAFGPSSLDYVLRCFLPDMDSRQQVTHDLHVGVDRELRKAGIEIAFPQQDVHVRSIPREPWLSGQVSAVRDDRDGRKARNAA